MNIENFKTHDQTCIGLQLECPVCKVILPRFKMAKHVLKGGLQHVHYFTESHFARSSRTQPSIGIKRPVQEIITSDDDSDENDLDTDSSSSSDDNE
jgi:hypothetical protein